MLNIIGKIEIRIKTGGHDFMRFSLYLSYIHVLDHYLA